MKKDSKKPREKHRISQEEDSITAKVANFKRNQYQKDLSQPNFKKWLLVLPGSQL